jgi:hypothetical protein
MRNRRLALHLAIQRIAGPNAGLWATRPANRALPVPADPAAWLRAFGDAIDAAKRDIRNRSTQA